MADQDTNRSTATPRSAKRLDSWKEIATYLSRDVTTVRRWEKREGLPVHRHRHGALGSVYAFADEIDAWQTGREGLPRPAESSSAETRQPFLVGRDSELRKLGAHLSHALDGTRQIVFVAGELGVGKTALTQTFADKLSSTVWVAAGQCVQHFGACAPYLALIDGLERLCREPLNRDAVRIVETYAPSWLDHIHLPGRSIRGANRVRDLGSRTERMAGELVEAIEALAATKPLVLLLEDLHWSDHSTVELIARLGRRAGHARLLLIGTYRQTELFDNGSPLVRVCRELRAHFQADEIELGLLTRADVAELIAREKTWVDVQRTATYVRNWSGNPLFLIHLLDHFERAGHLSERNGRWDLNVDPRAQAIVPNSLRVLVEEQFDRLDPESRNLLEIAGVVNEVFQAALVAAAAQREVSTVERTLEDLRRRSNLLTRRENVEWPDYTCSASYAFGHEFYRQVIYERLPSATLADWHRRIGDRLERAYNGRESDVASQLATHFDRGHDAERAVYYYGVAAESALSRNADREAQIGLSRAAELLAQLPPEKRHELQPRLDAQLRAILRKVRDANHWFDRALPDPFDVLAALISLSWFHSVTGDLQAARDIGDRAVAVAKHSNLQLVEAIGLQAYVRLLAGEFENARAIGIEALAVAERKSVAPADAVRRTSLSVIAWTNWYLGQYDESRAAIRQFIRCAPPEPKAGILQTNTSVAPILECLGDTTQSLAVSEQERKLMTSTVAPEGLWANAVFGWLLARHGRVAEGVSILKQTLKALHDLGMHAALPQAFAWLAEAYLTKGRALDASRAAENGLESVRRTNIRDRDAELHRLRGDALRQSLRGGSEPTADRNRDLAEASIWAGISVARQQNAVTLELRLAISLARLLMESGRDAEARQILAPILDLVATAADTPDLAAAKALLASPLSA